MILKIAIPVVDGRLLGHLGETKQFAIVEAQKQSGVLICMQIVAAPVHEPGSFPRWLREQSVHVLIVSHHGIGRRALDNLIYHGLEVCSGRPGTPVDALVVAYLGGLLPPVMDACDRHSEKRECQLAGYLKGQMPVDSP